MTYVNIHLFGKPGNEIDLEKAKPKDIKELGETIKERLNRVSEIMEKLENNGWENHGGLYDLILYKDLNEIETKIELKELDIDKRYINIDLE